MQHIIKGVILHTGTEVLDNQDVIIENGRISELRNSTEKPSGYHLAAGLIDLHINGGEKYYFTQNPDEQTLDDIYKSCVALGTCYMLPTLITSPLENILKGIEVTKNYMAKESSVLGMHLEGPFLNMAKRGAHQAQYVRKPTNTELEEIIKYGKDVIKIMTIAPENFTDEQIEMLVESGIKISAGHSNATYKEAKNGFDKGIKLITHLFNAMSQLGHREPGLVGATFDNDEVYAPIILDGYHCDYAAARIAYKTKKDKLILISDALFLNGKVKHFKWQEFDAFLENNQYRNSEGNLAGAAISLADCVRNAVEKVGISLEEAIKMATVRPAKAINIDDKIGRVEVGYSAVFTKFKSDLSEFKSLIIK